MKLANAFTLLFFIVLLVYSHTSAAQTAAAALPNASSVKGVIASLGQKNAYTFTASVGEFVFLRVGEPDRSSFFPAVTVTAPNGTRFGYDDGREVAQINGRIEVAGEYSVVVRERSDDQVGRYVIELVRVPGANELGPVSEADPVEDEIGVGDIDSYTLNASAGEALHVHISDFNRTGLVPRVDVFGPDGSSLASSSGPTVGSLRTRATRSGLHSIIVRDDSRSSGDTGNDDGAGPYRLYVAGIPGANEHGVLTNGGVASQNIDVGDIDTYTFRASSGERIFLQIADPTSADLVPEVWLYAPSGEALDVSSGLSVGSFRVSASETGTYTVLVRDNSRNSGSTANDDATGSYKLYLATAPGASEFGLQRSGARIADFIDVGDLDSFTFVARQGERINLTLTRTSGDRADRFRAACIHPVQKLTVRTMEI
ncbi:MAG: hypothetical protein AAGL66_16890 [Pseudomonadota bacterium]